MACTWEDRRLQALPAAPLVELALDAGYADQAHMTAEVTRLAGVSPVRLFKNRTPTASRGLMTEAQIEAHLDAVEAGQHDDGAGCSTGWPGHRRRRPRGAASSRFAR